MQRLLEDHGKRYAPLSLDNRGTAATPALPSVRSSPLFGPRRGAHADGEVNFHVIHVRSARLMRESR